MSVLREVGQAIGGDRIAYCFGGISERVVVRGDAYHGELIAQGVAMIDVALYAFITLEQSQDLPRYGPRRSELSTDPLDRVICQEAEFACYAKPILPRDPIDGGFNGTLHTGASVKIRRTLP